MGNFQGGGNRGGGFRGGNGGGRPNFGGNRGGDRGEVSMHKAVCDECHKSCEVPFRPSGDKPVYCNDCFSGKRDNQDRAPRREFDNKSSSFSKPVSSQDDIKKQLNDMNVKIDRLISNVEKLVSNKVESKPVAKSIPVVLPKKVETKKVIVVKKVAPIKVAAKKVIAKKVITKKK